MNLIKKNIVLVIVLAITLVISATMIFFVIKATGDMKKSTDAVAELRDKINVLNEKIPAPLHENLVRIQNDHKMLLAKVEELLPIFGVPYGRALEAFAKKLGDTPQNLKAQWAEIYRREMARGGNRALIFISFLSSFDSDKVKEAIEAFKNEVTSTSHEVVNEATLHGCLMEALGLPRRMDEMSCKLFIQTMQNTVYNSLKSSEEGQTPVLFLDATAEKLSFEKFETAMPMPKEVPFIFKHWRMVDDVCRRIKASGITSIDLFKRENFIEGTQLYRDYIVFDYTLKVRGSLESIRNLMNSMMDAHREHKIYIIKNVILKTNDEVAGILGGTAGTPVPGGIKRPPAPKRPPGGLLQPGAEEEHDTAPKELGVPIIGVNATVTAEIRFEYVLYVGNEIKE